MTEDIFFEIPQDLPREGPGAGRNIYTKNAFHMLPKLDRPRILDIGCGRGGPTLELARLSQGEIIGVDIHQPSLDSLARKIEGAGLSNSVKAVNRSMFNMDFTDESFDVAFTVGGFNFFRDKQVAIHELIRVSKPGARILIVDETEKHVRKTYEKTPLARRAFKGEDRTALDAPVRLVPEHMRDIRCEEAWNGRFYSLSFVKP